MSDKDEIILDLFDKGLSMSAISKKLEVGISVIRNVFKRLGLKSKFKSTRRENPLINNKDIIINRYLNGESSYKIAKDYGCQDSSIVKFLIKFGISLRENRKLNYDFDYFKIIDREDKAYTLGILYADGNNSDKGNNYSIRLSMIDKDVVEKIKKYMNFDGEIREIKPRKLSYKTQYRLSISGKNICYDLTKLGCHSNKTHTLCIPEGAIPEELFRHFLRGLNDGDGTITRSKGKKNWLVRIVGTKELMQQIGDKVKEILDINYSYFPAKNCESGDIYFCAWGGRNKLTKLLNWMYKDSTIHMDRKYAKYQEFLASTN